MLDPKDLIEEETDAFDLLNTEDWEDDDADR